MGDPHLQLRIDIVEEPGEIFAAKVFAKFASLLHITTHALALPSPGYCHHHSDGFATGGLFVINCLQSLLP